MSSLAAKVLMALFGVAFVVCFVIAAYRAWRRRRPSRDDRFANLMRSSPPLADDAFADRLGLDLPTARATAVEVRRAVSLWAAIPRQRLQPATSLAELREIVPGTELTALFARLRETCDLDMPDDAAHAIETMADLVYFALARHGENTDRTTT